MPLSPNHQKRRRAVSVVRSSCRTTRRPDSDVSAISAPHFAGELVDTTSTRRLQFSLSVLLVQRTVPQLIDFMRATFELELQKVGDHIAHGCCN